MSQKQLQRDEAQEETIKYGDVFKVSGDLASKPVAPQDASLMQSAENLMLGKTQKGGVAAVMQSAADLNERAGLVKHDDVTDIARDQGMSITESNALGTHVVAESVGGQVVGKYSAPAPVQTTPPSTSLELERDQITIGEALESAAIVAGDKPVDRSDATAIQVAEVRTTGRNVITTGGVAARAQSAAILNERTLPEEGKTRLAHVLTGATTKLPVDKAVTREDAEGMVGAEMRNNLDMVTHPGGVAESVAEASWINQNI